MAKVLPGERLYPLLSELSPGDCVKWRRYQRGGYGHVTVFPAKVVRVGAKRVTIEICGANNVLWQVSVTPESLREHTKREGGKPLIFSSAW